jgi:hypothetical protein
MDILRKAGPTGVRGPLREASSGREALSKTTLRGFEMKAGATKHNAPKKLGFV